MHEAGHLVTMFARATRANRVLAIASTATLPTLSLAQVLPATGMFIVLERDAAAAVEIRRALVSADLASRVSVVVGDAARYLHKIAGPFDLIFHDGDAARYPHLHDRIVRLLAPSGTLITHKVIDRDSYNRVLATDRRLSTALLNVQEGVAISVRTPDHDT